MELSIEFDIADPLPPIMKNSKVFFLIASWFMLFLIQKNFILQYVSHLMPELFVKGTRVQVLLRSKNWTS